MASFKYLLQKIRHSIGGIVSAKDARLLATVKRDLLPQNYSPQDNFVPHNTIGDAGIELNIEEQLELLQEWQHEEYQNIFKKLRNNDDLNVGYQGKSYRELNLIHNGYYPSPDAEIYAAMIAKFRPSLIVEIGSGYSTVIAKITLDHIGYDCNIKVIDPQPRRNIEAFANEIEYRPIEKSSLVNYKLPSKTILFIDSSHICRSLGDLPFIYCTILPKLKHDIIVHVHDIFTPFDYPDNYYDRFFNEQYLLHCLLANSNLFKVIFATHLLCRKYTKHIRNTFGQNVASDPLFFGASFWMKT